MWGFPLILQIQEQILSAVENVFSHLDAGEVRDKFLYTSNENLPPIWPETYGTTCETSPAGSLCSIPTITKGIAKK